MQAVSPNEIVIFYLFNDILITFTFSLLYPRVVSGRVTVVFFLSGCETQKNIDLRTGMVLLTLLKPAAIFLF